MIKGVIFDMDGLMIDTEKYYNYFFRVAAKELDMPLEKEHALLIRNLSPEVAGKLLRQECGEDYDHKKVLARCGGYIRTHFAENGIEVKPGLYELLEYLEAAGLQLSVATSTKRSEALESLNKIGVAKYFTHICSGAELAHGKPAPDIYIQTTRLMGLEPEECVALEDSPNGVRSAAAAGCRTIMVPDLSQPDDELRALLWKEVESLDQVIPILQSAL